MANGLRSALVTGATGFIGTRLVQQLCRRGVETFCLTRRPAPELVACGATVVVAPEAEGESLRRALQPYQAEVVFHLAAGGVAPDARTTTGLIDGNVTLVAKVMEAVRDWPLKRFIHTGSCSEYASLEAPERLTEKSPLAASSLYGAAKAASVLFADALAQRFGMPFTVLRPFGVFGPGEAPQRLVPHLIQSLRGGQPAELTGGAQLRDFCYVDDVVDAFVQAAEAPNIEQHRIYNICSGRPTSVRQVAEAVADALEVPRERLLFGARPYRADEAMWIVGDASRFAAVTGWAPRTGLAQGIATMVEESSPAR